MDKLQDQKMRSLIVLKTTEVVGLIEGENK